jgi:hypothetical protein
MKHPKIYLLIVAMAVSTAADAQKVITALDFESPVDVKAWWVDNPDVRLSICGPKDGDPAPGSAKCLRIQWDHVPASKSYTWLTDIKIDTFGNQAMQNTWNSFKENTWLSFKVNTAGADSVYFQFIIFTSGEKDKWGSRETIGFNSGAWKTVKVKLSSLHYDNWGKGNVAAPDLDLVVPARIEIGIRSPRTNATAKIDLRLDNVTLTNYKP